MMGPACVTLDTEMMVPAVVRRLSHRVTVLFALAMQPAEKVPAHVSANQVTEMTVPEAVYPS
ncbi:MAG: hypothetical protein KTR25_19465 [Myxococcales bacterium]|nr:hypothetical protein [Myxococcales bacterium]